MLEYLYGISAFIAICAYLPTVFELLKGKPSASIPSYLLWLMTTLIGLFYVSIKIQDTLLIWSYGAHFALCLIIIILRLRIQFQQK